MAQSFSFSSKIWTLTFKIPHQLNCNVTRLRVQSHVFLYLYVYVCVFTAYCLCENVTLDLGSEGRSASGHLPTRSNVVFY